MTALGAPINGVLTQCKILPKNALVKLPEDYYSADEETAALVCTGVTAWNALYGIKDCFIASQSVLKLGTGDVSIIALILAKAAGATTIVNSPSDEKLKYVKQKYGVHTINYRTHPDWEKEVMKITLDQSINFIIENGGKVTIVKSLASIKYGGQIALIGFLGQAEQAPEVLL
jgi:NADPH:quinone reductase-like Zn-dependent oxidoreductase